MDVVEITMFRFLGSNMLKDVTWNVCIDNRLEVG